MLFAEMAVAEGAVANDALGGRLAVLEGAALLLGRHGGVVEVSAGSVGRGLGRWRTAEDQLGADKVCGVG